jgi:hypothetical protein
MLHGMSRGFDWPRSMSILAAGAVVDWAGVFLILGSLAIVWLFPNSQQFVVGSVDAQSASTAPQKRALFEFVWEPERWWTWSAVGALLGLSILMMTPAGVSKFLYYQF